jgi:hypothetical protein
MKFHVVVHFFVSAAGAWINKLHNTARNTVKHVNNMTQQAGKSPLLI